MIHGPDVGPTDSRKVEVLPQHMPEKDNEKTASGEPIDELLVRRLAKEAEEGFEVGDIIKRRIEFPCAFCGGSTTKIEIATFTLSWRDKEQFWFGHAQCFVDALEHHFRDLRPEWEDLDIARPHVNDIRGDHDDAS